MSRYRVTGPVAYRGHDPGVTFEAELDPIAERRALLRGQIVLLDSSPTRLQPGSFTLPAGWIDNPALEGAQLKGTL